MDIKKVISFDKGIRWKVDHTSNPYAIVLKAQKIWYFTEKENSNSYTFFKLLVQDNAKPFKWGLQHQKTIMVFKHNEYYYFMAPPDIVYKVLPKEDSKKKRRGKK